MKVLREEIFVVSTYTGCCIICKKQENIVPHKFCMKYLFDGYRGNDDVVVIDVEVFHFKW